MLSSSLYAMLKLYKTAFPQKLFDYDCITLYMYNFQGYKRLKVGGGYIYVYTIWSGSVIKNIYICPC